MSQNEANKETDGKRYPLWNCDTNASLPNHTNVPGEDDSYYGNGIPKNQPERKEVPLLTKEYGPEQSYQKYESDSCYVFMFRTEDTCVPRDIELLMRNDGVRVMLAKVPKTAKKQETQSVEEKKAEQLRKDRLRAEQRTESLVAMDPCMGKHGIPSSEVTVPPHEQNIQTMTIPAELRKKLGQTHFYFALPPDANCSQAQVHYSEEDGVISISLPKIVRMLELRFN